MQPHPKTNRSSELDPIILFANHFQFKPGQSFSFPCVQSRMLVCCAIGNGTIRVNGASFTMTTGRYLFLPWNHSIAYAAAPKDPMLLLGIHIIPVFAPVKESFDYLVPHRPTDPFFDDKERCDRVIAGLEGVRNGIATETGALVLLLRFIVEWFRREPRQESAARNLARLLLEELQQAAGTEHAASRLRFEMQRVIDYAQANISGKISIDAMAKIAQCSASTLSRMIRKYSGASPIQWLLRMRMEHAGILLSTTGIRIGEVGIQSGIEDPYYFSKLFKKHHGMTAREFRRKNSLF
jgi:AraC-like DNA-binding protein